MKRPAISFTLFLLILPVILAACTGKGENIYRETRSSMHTVVTITAVSKSEATAAAAFDKAFIELDRIAGLLNFYDEKSEISIINRNAGEKPVRVSPDTFEIIEKALHVSEITDGSFDVTVGPLVRLWDFNRQIIPDSSAISKARQRVGYRNVILDKAASTVFIKTKDTVIDLGGIIKGFAADKVAELLKREGISSGIAAVGGDIRFFGERPDGRPWAVGIQNPRQKGVDDEIIGSLRMGDQGISTSGDYMKYFEKNNIRYHHVIDPATGYPSKSCGSVTVVAPGATLSDAFSTGIFVLGPRRGLEAAKKAGVEAIYIDCLGKREMTEGLNERISPPPVSGGSNAVVR